MDIGDGGGKSIDGSLTTSLHARETMSPVHKHLLIYSVLSAHVPRFLLPLGRPLAMLVRAFWKLYSNKDISQALILCLLP